MNPTPSKVTAKLNYLRVAPRKMRLVADSIKGLPVSEAEAQLLFRAKRSSKPLLGLLRSAIANAKNNHKLSSDKLTVKEILVNQGPTIKRFLPRAMGRATPINKRTSHVILVLEENSKVKSPRFSIAAAAKRKLPKEERIQTGKKPKLSLQKEQPKAEKAGFFKRFFRRKSV